MIKTDEDMSRIKFAKSIDKSGDVVKIGMRRGKFKDDNIFKGTKYLFKPREAIRIFQGVSPLTKVTKNLIEAIILKVNIQTIVFVNITN